jgi:hypothetical protein
VVLYNEELLTPRSTPQAEGTLLFDSVQLITIYIHKYPPHLEPIFFGSDLSTSKMIRDERPVSAFFYC